MPISKINYGERTLMDLTKDTVTSETLLEGATAHDASGTIVTGNVKISEIDQTFNAESPNAQSGIAVAEAFAATKAYIDNNKTSIVMKTWTSSDAS